MINGVGSMAEQGFKKRTYVNGLTLEEMIEQGLAFTEVGMFDENESLEEEYNEEEYQAFIAKLKKEHKREE